MSCAGSRRFVSASASWSPSSRATASRWEALLDTAANATPAVLDVTAEQQAALGGGDVPHQLLRIPLTVQSELVGMILAAGDIGRFAAEANLLDFAATLGNSAAMAIANARLHTIVLAHRAELQRLSNKRIDVVEEACDASRASSTTASVRR